MMLEVHKILWSDGNKNLPVLEMLQAELLQHLAAYLIKLVLNSRFGDSLKKLDDEMDYAFEKLKTFFGEH